MLSFKLFFEEKYPDIHRGGTSDQDIHGYQNLWHHVFTTFLRGAKHGASKEFEHRGHKFTVVNHRTEGHPAFERRDGKSLIHFVHPQGASYHNGSAVFAHEMTHFDRHINRVEAHGEKFADRAMERFHERFPKPSLGHNILNAIRGRKTHGPDAAQKYYYNTPEEQQAYHTTMRHAQMFNGGPQKSGKEVLQRFHPISKHFTSANRRNMLQKLDKPIS